MDAKDGVLRIMTTIAYKDGIIAYDSLATSDETIIYDDYEKCIESNGAKFIICGDISESHELINAYFGVEIKSELNISAIVVDKGVAWYATYNEKFRKMKLLTNAPFSIGSGSEYAIAAMDMGATAAEAVGIAMKRDLNTGGRIKILKVV